MVAIWIISKLDCETSGVLLCYKSINYFSTSQLCCLGFDRAVSTVGVLHSMPCLVNVFSSGQIKICVCLWCLTLRSHPQSALFTRFRNVLALYTLRQANTHACTDIHTHTVTYRDNEAVLCRRAERRGRHSENNATLSQRY